MATNKKSQKRDILGELFAIRDKNIEAATKWNVWEIENQIKSAISAKESFLDQNPNHDLRIINEHINQLNESLRIRLKNQFEELNA